MGFCARDQLHGAVLGEWLAGRPMAVHVPRPNVIIHEISHEGLNQATSLGHAAIMCGAIDIYTPDGDPRRPIARAFLNAFYRNCGWIHEGVATMRELLLAGLDGAMPADDIIAHRPRSYVHAAGEAMHLAEASGAPYGRESTDALLAFTTAAAAPAAVAMSVRVEPDDLLAILHGDAIRWRRILQQVWPRYARIRAFLAGSPPIAGRLAEVLPPPGSPAERWVASTETLARRLAECAGLEWGARPSVVDFIAEHLPDLRKNVVFAAPTHDTDISMFARHAFRSILNPEVWNTSSASPNDLLAMAPSRFAPLRVLELSAGEEGQALLAIHGFDSNGQHTRSVAVQLAEPASGTTLRQLVDSYHSVGDGHCRGVVAATETVADHLRDITVDVPLLETALFGNAYEEVVQHEVLGVADYAGLARVQVRSRREPFWYAEPESNLSLDALTPLDRAYLAVLRNGLSAHIRWYNYHRSRS